MKRQTELKSVRYGISFRPSKSTVVLTLVAFFLVINVVKSTTIHEEEEFTDESRNADSNTNGELNFYR